MKHKVQRTYLILMWLTLFAMFVIELLFIELDRNEQLLGFLIPSIGYLIAYFIFKWYGRALLFVHLIFWEIVPTLAGLISSRFITKSKIKYVQFLCATFVLLFFVAQLISYTQGLIGPDWKPDWHNIMLIICKSFYWFLICGYTFEVFNRTKESIKNNA